MPDISAPLPIQDDVSAPTTSPIESPLEDAFIAESSEVNVYEPLREESAASEYFSTVPEEEALNYIMMLREGGFITFERFTELQDLLKTTKTLIPFGEL